MAIVINIEDQRKQLILEAEKLYNAVKAIPANERGDRKIRTGISVLVRQVGTRNFILFGVCFPPEATNFFVVEKAVRSEIFYEVTSQSSENEEILRFSGSVTFTTEDKTLYQVSISGMQPHEDAGMSVALMAKFLQIEVSKVITNITKNLGGVLPDYFNDKKHYMQPIIGY